MPNGIYLYLYQNAQTEVELIPFEPREDHVGRKYLSIGVFVPHAVWWGATRVAEAIRLGSAFRDIPPMYPGRF